MRLKTVLSKGLLKHLKSNSMGKSNYDLTELFESHRRLRKSLKNLTKTISLDVQKSDTDPKK
jgi:hypothetical protein